MGTSFLSTVIKVLVFSNTTYGINNRYKLQAVKDGGVCCGGCWEHGYEQNLRRDVRRKKGKKGGWNGGRPGIRDVIGLRKKKGGGGGQKFCDLVNSGTVQMNSGDII